MISTRGGALLLLLVAGLLAWTPLVALTPAACAAGRGSIDSFMEQNRKAFEKDLKEVEETYGENCGEDGEGVDEDEEEKDKKNAKPKPKPKPGPGPGPGPGGPGGPGRDFGNDDYVVEKVWIELVLSRSGDGSPDPFDNDDVEKLFKNGRVITILIPGGTPTGTPGGPTGAGACVPPTSTGPSATFPAAAISNDLSGCQTATNSVAAGAIPGSSEVLVIEQSPAGGIRISFINNGPFIFSNATGATSVGANQFDAPSGATVTFNFDHTTSGGNAALTFTVRDAGGGNVSIENASLTVN